MFGEDFPSVVPNKLKSHVVWPRTYHIFQNPININRNLGPAWIGKFNAIRPQVPYRSSGKPVKKLYGPTRDPATKTNSKFLNRWKQIISDAENLNFVSGYRIPLHFVTVQLHVPGYIIFRCNSTPCRSLQT